MNRYPTLGLMAVLFMLGGCKHGPAITEQTQELVFARDSVKNDADGFNVAIVFDAPDRIDSGLGLAVAEHFSETLGGSYDGPVSDFRSIAGHYYDSRAAVIRGLCTDDGPYSGSEMAERCFDRVGYEVFAESGEYFSVLCTETAYSGGAHGSTRYSGATFRKSDGRRIGWDVVAPDVYSEKLQAVITKGLRQYWGLDEDTPLKNWLLDVPEWQIPLPACPPVFGEDGVTFIYNEYEIAAYAAGRPRFTVPYDDMAEFMMVTAKRLVD